jgi:hypothetical protein
VPTKSDLPNLPEALADAALIDGPTCAAVGKASVSWWHGKVASGEAPQPAIRQSRFTRWRLAEVRAFWLALAESATHDAQVTQRAKQASIKAREPEAVARARATRKTRAAARLQAGA